MKLWERSCHISRIVSGQTRVRINSFVFYVSSPTRLQQCLADELFMEQLEEGEIAGAYCEDELKEFLDSHGIWNEEDEQTLKVLYEDLEKLKVGLFEMQFRSVEQSKIRLRIPRCKQEINRLETLKHSYDHISALGIALNAKHRYLLGCSISTEDGPYWNNDAEGWNSPDPFLDKIMFALNKIRLSESEFREIARTEPWRGSWNLRKHCNKGIFDCSVVDLTDEQKNLIVWSSIYESVREHPDNLEERIIEDDDLVDGWMIIKRKEREQNHIKNNVDHLSKNDKIKNSQEIFKIVDSVEDAQKVMNYNDEVGARRFNQRMAAIKEKGEVREQDLPDTAARLRQERIDKFFELNKAKGKA